MSNKVKYGLKNVKVASVTETSGAFTFGTPAAWPGAVSMSLEPKGDTAEFYADDTVYWTGSSNDGYDGTLESALVPDWFREQYLGQTLNTDGLLVEQSTDAAAPFAILFEFTADDKAIRHALYYCKASRGKDEGETKSDKMDPKTDEITFVATALPGNSIIKAKTTDTTTEAKYDAWYTTVTLPATTTE